MGFSRGGIAILTRNPTKGTTRNQSPVSGCPERHWKPILADYNRCTLTRLILRVSAGLANRLSGTDSCQYPQGHTGYQSPRWQSQLRLLYI